MASQKGCKSVSTDDTVSDEGGRLGDMTVSLGAALEVLGGGALPHKKLINSSLRIVLLRFFTQAKTSLLRRWWPIWIPKSKLLLCASTLSVEQITVRSNYVFNYSTVLGSRYVQTHM